MAFSTWRNLEQPSNHAETSWNFCLLVPVHVRMCPYIIKVIGLGLGLTIWDLSNMLMGWFTRLFWAFWHPQGRQRKDAIHKLCWIGHGIVVPDLFFLGLCLWYFGHAGCDEQIGCRAGFKGRQAQSLWTDTALGLRSIIGIHWEKNQQCLRNEKLRVVAVGFTLEGCIECPTQQCLFLMFFRSVFCCCSRMLSESFLHLENFVECPKYKWYELVN